MMDDEDVVPSNVNCDIPTTTNDDEMYSESTEDAYIRKPTRKIIIEPILVIFMFVTFPMALLSQQYIVNVITQSKMHEKGWINITDWNETGSHCVNQSAESYIFQQEVQADASQFNIFMSLAAGVPSLFTTIFLGGLSDKIGRKYAILMPIIGTFVRTLSYILVILLNLSIWYLLIGSFLDGCLGSYQTLLMGCFSYIADITAPDQRQLRIAIVELIMIMSGMFGPIGVGVWIQHMGMLPPLLLILALISINVVYIVFFVPETVIRQPNSRILSFDHIKKTLLLFTRDDESRRRWKLCTLLAAFVVIALMMSSNVSAYWATEEIGFVIKIWAH